MRYLLLCTNPTTGYVRVLTFESRCDRALHMITLAGAPLVLQPVDA